jgi:hypothetical protein
MMIRFEWRTTKPKSNFSQIIAELGLIKFNSVDLDLPSKLSSSSSILASKVRFI